MDSFVGEGVRLEKNLDCLANEEQLATGLDWVQVRVLDGVGVRTSVLHGAYAYLSAVVTSLVLVGMIPWHEFQYSDCERRR
jgi:hypothetical protein